MFKAIKEFFVGKPVEAPKVEEAPYKVETPKVEEVTATPVEAPTSHWPFPTASAIAPETIKTQTPVTKAPAKATAKKAPAKKKAATKKSPKK